MSACIIFKGKKVVKRHFRLHTPTLIDKLGDEQCSNNAAARVPVMEKENWYSAYRYLQAKHADQQRCYHSRLPQDNPRTLNDSIRRQHITGWVTPETKHSYSNLTYLHGSCMPADAQTSR